MSTLSRLFSQYNDKIFGKYINVSKDNAKKFEAVEQMLTRSGIDLDEYVLTIFTDRLHLGANIGYLPAKTFLSPKSMERYIARLSAGCEVTRKEKSEPANFFGKTEQVLALEMSIGRVIMRCIECDEPIPDLETELDLPEGYMRDHRRPMEEAAMWLAFYSNTEIGTYEDMGKALRQRLQPSSKASSRLITDILQVLS